MVAYLLALLRPDQGVRTDDGTDRVAGDQLQRQEGAGGGPPDNEDGRPDPGRDGPDRGGYVRCRHQPASTQAP